VGTKVEARYRGRERWYPGVISRVRLNGTFDVDYDDGEKEQGVAKDLIRTLGGTSRKSPERRRDADMSDAEDTSLRVGTKVEARYRGRERWYPGVISRVRLNGTFDVDYDDGECESYVEKPLIRILDFGSFRSSKLVSKFALGERVSCFYYRKSQYGSCRVYDTPKEAIIIHCNSDRTYTVEVVGDSVFLEDVPEEHIRHWNNDDHRSKLIDDDAGSNLVSGRYRWVIEMAKQMAKDGRLSGHVELSDKSLRSLSSSTSSKAMLENIERIIGIDALNDFKLVFNDEDDVGNGMLTEKDVLRAFKRMGAATSLEEIRRWANVNGKDGAPLKVFSLAHFIMAYAELFFNDIESTLKSNSDTSKLGKTLGLSDKFSDLAKFALAFGKKQLVAIEHAFDAFSKLDVNGERKLPVSSVIEAFHRLGKAITVSRLQEWMIDSDVNPRDELSLADFVALYSFFFGPTKESPLGSTDTARLAISSNMSLPEIASQIAAEERWRGTTDQVIGLIERLCAGRSSGAIGIITKIRDLFEAEDERSDGSIHIDKVNTILKNVGISSSNFDKFKEKVSKLRHGSVVLPDIFEQFGMEILEVASQSASVSEAFAMLRFHCSAQEVREAAETALKIVDNILLNPENPKFWRINVASEEFKVKIWRHEAGKLLMKAIGFGDPKPLAGADGVVRPLIGLRALSNPTKKLPHDVASMLRSRRHDLNAEVVALDGAPSVGGIVRAMCEKHGHSAVRVGLETALTFVRNILTKPTDLRMYRVKKSNPLFQRTLGSLEGHEQLMRAIGFHGATDSVVGGGAPPAENPSQTEPEVVAYVLKMIGESEFDPVSALALENGAAGKCLKWCFSIHSRT
jgi:Ca2+-binding EF-hand superfamily protein